MEGFTGRGLAGLVASCLSVMACWCQPVGAADFRFVPPGDQLDDDVILDYILNKGDVITFSVVADTTGIPTLGTATTVQYSATFSWDTSELESVEYPNRNSITGWIVSGKNGCGATAGNPCSFFEGLPGSNNNNPIRLPYPFNFIGLDTVNNGITDFSLQFGPVYVYTGNDRESDVTDYFGPLKRFDERGNDNINGPYYQVMEVQPVPGPLPLLGIGAAFGYSRRLRKRIKLKLTKTPEVMSAVD